MDHQKHRQPGGARSDMRTLKMEFGKRSDPKPDIRRTPVEVLVKMARNANEHLERHFVVQLLLAVVAGSFVAFGAGLSVFLAAEVESTGPRNLLLGIGFAAGFFLVVNSSAALFTEVGGGLLSGLQEPSSRSRCICRSTSFYQCGCTSSAPPGGKARRESPATCCRSIASLAAASG
eukprot:scaffold733_cov267-Pinguiococcus_pyrenoidosus.AAC.12